jgi:putative transposase
MTLFKNKYRVATTRLKGWDYRTAGYYFVTICTRNREHFFGEITYGVVCLSPLGETTAKFWAEIPSHHTGVELDEYVIMPHHIHGIIMIIAPEPTVETLRATSLPATFPHVISQ